MSVPRTIKRFFSENSLVVDLGQSWKLYDNNQNFNTVVVYNGVIYEPKNSRRRTNIRVNWIETDKGPFLLETDADYQEASARTGMTMLHLRNIIMSNPVKCLKEEDAA